MLLGKPVANLMTTETDESLILKTSVKKSKSSTKGLRSIEIFSRFFSFYSLNLLNLSEMRVTAQIFCTVISTAGNKEAFIAAPPRPPETLMHLKHLTYVSLTRSTFHLLKSDSASKAPQPIN